MKKGILFSAKIMLIIGVLLIAFMGVIASSLNGSDLSAFAYDPIDDCPQCHGKNSLVFGYDGGQHWLRCTNCVFCTEKENHYCNDNEWKTDGDDTHWQLCSFCYEPINETGHEDEDENGLCDVCGCEYTGGGGGGGSKTCPICGEGAGEFFSATGDGDGLTHNWWCTWCAEDTIIGESCVDEDDDCYCDYCGQEYAGGGGGGDNDFVNRYTECPNCHTPVDDDVFYIDSDGEFHYWYCESEDCRDAVIGEKEICIDSNHDGCCDICGWFLDEDEDGCDHDSEPWRYNLDEHYKHCDWCEETWDVDEHDYDGGEKCIVCGCDKPHYIAFFTNDLQDEGWIPEEDDILITKDMVGTTYTLPGNTRNLKRYGYIFVGWNTNKNATVGLVSVTIPSKASLHFYAIWEKATCQIMSAGAKEHNGYRTIGEALTEAGTTATTIRLEKNNEENITIASGATITLDLNGYVLKASATGSVIKNNGTLTIIDSNASAVHKYVVNSSDLWVWDDNAENGTQLSALTARPASGSVIIVPGGAITGGVGEDRFDVDTATTHFRVKNSGGAIFNRGTLNMNAGTIIGNSASSSDGMGGGIYNAPLGDNTDYLESKTSVVNLSGTAAIIGNTAFQGAGIYNGTAHRDPDHGKGNFTMTGNSRVSFNTSVSEGGGIWTRRIADISGNSAINYNKGGDGAGFFAFSEDSVITISGNVTFDHNDSTAYGGGLYLKNVKSASITDATISYNTTTNNGGGILLRDATLTIVRVTITKNSSVYDGGGIYNGGGTITMTDGEISYNTGNWGAGIENYGGTYTMNGGTISYNEASVNGGGIDNYNATLTFNKGTISNNSASSGGGLYIENTLFTMNGGTISDNEATGSGGGVYSKGTFTMTDGSITDNEANSGGGINSAGTLTVAGGTITSNTGSDGGGVYSKGTFTMTGGSITGNKAIWSAGIGAYGTTNLLGGSITANTITATSGTYGNDFYGAGCLVMESGKLIVGGTIAITDNLCNGEKDNLVFSNVASDVTIAVSTEKPLTTGASIGVRSLMIIMEFITGCPTDTYKGYFSSDNENYPIKTEKIADNNYTYSVAHVCNDIIYGRPIRVGAMTTGKYALVADTTLTGSLTIASTETVKICLNGKVLNLNGHSISNAGTLTISDCDTTAEHKYVVNSSDLWVWNDNAENGTKLSALTARPASGSVIIVPGGAITGGVGEDRFDVDTATTHFRVKNSGGAIFNRGTLNMNAGTIIGNSASSSDGMGGGIYNAPLGDNTDYLESKTSVVNLSGTAQIIGNTAFQGAGIYNGTAHRDPDHGKGNFTMTGNSRVSFNTSVSEGGGIWTRRIADISGNSAINYNKGGDGAGFFAFSEDSVITISGNVTFDHNDSTTNGGGLYLKNVKSVSITDATITYNTAGCGGGIYFDGVPSASVTDTVISNNTSTEDAGGIDLDGSNCNVTITDVTISDNEASYGGGILVHAGATLTIASSTISRNESSSSGGGIYNWGGTITMTDGEITYNKSPWGAGIENDSGTYTMNGGTISYNEATESGGGIDNCSGTYTMNGGTISYNEATEDGGGVYSDGTFTMTGGTITDNEATESGGGVYSKGTFTMTGGTITSNTGIYGGGVYSKGTFTMTGGSITGNKATWGAGINMGGTTNLLGGSITGNTITCTEGEWMNDYGGAGIDVYTSKLLTVGGDIVITGNKTNGELDNIGIENQYGEDILISVSTETPLKQGASIGIYLGNGTGIFVSGVANTTDISYFSSDNTTYALKAREIANSDPKAYTYGIEQQYTITYDKNDATSGTVPTDTTKYLAGDSVTLAGNTGSLAKTGYKFLGWAKTSSATEALTSYSVLASDATDGVITLYAVWEEKAVIAIDTDLQRIIYDGTSQKPILKDTEGEEIALSGFSYTYQLYYKTDYATCSDTKEPGLYEAHVTRDEDDTYKAVDTLIEFVVTYSLTYKANTGIGEDVIDDGYNETAQKEYFGAYVESALETYEFDKQAIIKANTFTKENYTFAFWNTKEDGTGTSYKKDDLLTLSANTVLYACYSADISKQPAKGNDYTVSVATTDSVTYVWEKEVEKITPVDLTQISGITGTVNSTDGKITAVYQSGQYYIVIPTTATQKLKFYTEGTLSDGVVGVENTYIYSPKVKIKALFLISGSSEFTISDINYYSLEYEAISGETASSISNANEKTSYRCAVKSKFNAVSYSDVITTKAISFDKNGATTGTAPTTQYQLEGRAVTLPANPFTRTDYKFIGWNTDKDATTKLDSYTAGASDVTIYAIWEAKTAVTITETAQTYTFGTSGSAFKIVGSTLSSFKVEYYVGSSWTESVPTDVGTYNVKVTRAEDATYAGFSKEITGGLVINKKDITLTITDVATGTYTYDGTAKTTVATYTALVGTDELSYTLSYDDNVNVGTCSVTIDSASISKGTANNYNIITTDTGTLVIDKKDITLTITDVATGTYTYDGTAKTTVATYTTLVGTDELSYTLSYDDNVNAGTCSVTIDSASISKGTANNYNIITTDTGTLVIDKKDITLTITDVATGTYTYDGTAKTTVATYTALVGTDELSYTLSYDDNVSAGTCSVTIDSASISKGTANNYNIITTDEGTLVIDKATYNMDDAEWNYTSAFTFDGTEKVVSVIGLPTGVTVKSYTDNAKTDAESYTAKVSFTYDTANYNEVSLSDLAWTISPKEIVIDWCANDFTYNGQDQKASVTASYKDITNEDIALKVDMGEFINCVDSGYTAKVSFANNETNYKLPTNVSKKYFIKKATAVITVDKTPIKVTYGDPITIPTATSNVGTVACDKVSADLVDVGTYTILYSIKSTKNYDGAIEMVSVSIAKLAVVEPTVIGTYTYTGKEQTVILKDAETYMTTTDSLVQTEVGEYEITYTLDRNHKWESGSDGKLSWTIQRAQAVIYVDQTPIVKTYGDSITIPTATSNFGTVKCNKTSSDLVNAGTYTITYTVDEAPGYAGTSASIDVTIKKYVVAEPTVSGKYVYNGKPHTVQISGIQDCMSTKDSFTKDAVGVYTITFTLDKNHAWESGDDGIVTWEIRAMSITPSTDKTTGGEAQQSQKNQVIVSTAEGFSSDISVKVEVVAEASVSDAIVNKELKTDYYNISQEDIKLTANEKIGAVYDVKLMQIIGDESKEIDISDLGEDTTLKVRILIPSDIRTSSITRIIAVYGEDEIEVIDFDSSKVDKSGYYEMEISRLSEIAFVCMIKEPCNNENHWVLGVILALVAILISTASVEAFHNSRRKVLILDALCLILAIVGAFFIVCSICIALYCCIWFVIIVGLIVEALFGSFSYPIMN